MYISKLIHTIENYDPYGIHRLNGVKVVYVLLLLFLVNMFANIPNVYFHYFYIPITAMSAEVQFHRVEDKFRAFTFTMLGTVGMAFLFNLLNPYPLFFLLAIFVVAGALYVQTILRKPMLAPFVPVIFSLAAYSLSYPNLNDNIYMLLLNASKSLLAWVIILSALLFFPLSLYYRIWLRAFTLLLHETRNNWQIINQKHAPEVAVLLGHTSQMVNFAQMLPRTLPTFTILKINLLASRLHAQSCVYVSPFTQTNEQTRQVELKLMDSLIEAVTQEQPCQPVSLDNRCLSVLIQTWNTLCLRT